MHDLPQLWLPILVAAVAVFIASSLIHLVLKWHNSDYRQLANEDEVQAALRAGSPAPGQYVLPWCPGMKEMESEAMKQKFAQGPIGFITVRPNGIPHMGGTLLQWFILNLVVAAVVAAIALQTLGLSGDEHDAAHLAGLLTFLTYAGGSVQLGIWMGKPWSSVFKDLLDGLIYGTVTALAFMWLWP